MIELLNVEGEVFDTFTDIIEITGDQETVVVKQVGELQIQRSYAREIGLGLVLFVLLILLAFFIHISHKKKRAIPLNKKQQEEISHTPPKFEVD